MASQPKLVNKQFNSPIGLYSDQNVREVLDRESKMLANGAVGINFHNPMSNKPANLHNSAVLRMLEEEESKQRNGRAPGVKRVAWPPPQGEGEEYTEESAVQTQGGAQYSSQAPVNGHNPRSPNIVHQAPVVNNYQPRPVTPVPALQKAPQSPVNNYQQRPVTPIPAFQKAPQSPVNFQPRPVTPVPAFQKAPHSPVIFNIPITHAFDQRPGNFAPATVVAKPWAPVQSPVSPQPSTRQPVYQQPQQYQAPYQPPHQAQYQSPQQQYSVAPQQYQPALQEYQHPSQQYQPPLQQPQSPQPQQRSPQPQNQVAAVPQPQHYQQTAPLPVKQVEPPPSLITLRPKTPISQAPAPVFFSQPATATLKGGKNLRGDLKWPPEDVRGRMDAENQARVDLAKGPAFRPRRVDKDYSPFFAQHALNSTYPGYKIPPGTQFYDHAPVM